MTGNEVRELGIPQGPKIGEALRLADLMGREGKTNEEIASTLIKIFGQEIKKLCLNDTIEGLPFFNALGDPTSETERDNQERSIKHMEEMMAIPVVKTAAIMPDACPAGGGITVGGIIGVENAIIPSAHSADICCSMRTTFFESTMTPKEMMDQLMASTHFGCIGGFDDVTTWTFTDENKYLRGQERIANFHFGTQGDGNHFASLGYFQNTPEFQERLSEMGYQGLEALNGKTGMWALTTHHGSRGLGAEVYKRGQRDAVKYTNSIARGIPSYGAWLSMDTQEGKDYWEALKIIHFWTRVNHMQIHSKFLFNLRAAPLFTLWNEHNFVWERKSQEPWEGTMYMHGKGATPTALDDGLRAGIIPLNMSEPILIVAGKEGNKFLDFAPHGAGRSESRTSLLKKYPNTGDSRGISPRDAGKIVEDQTKGLDIRWYNGKPDISESPIAYKPASEIIQAIKQFDLADVIGSISPVGCIMSGASDFSWKKKNKKVENVIEQGPEDTEGVSAKLLL